MKTRVLIRAHTVRRDIGMSALVEMGLQQLGYETFICSVHNFQRTLRWWKPHVVITQTAGSAHQAREILPGALVVFLDAEGYQPEYNSWATFWEKNQPYYDALDLILAWGPILGDEVRRLMPTSNVSKLHVVSSPKFDLLEHMRKSAPPISTRNSIGIITRYPSINNHEGVPAIRGLHVKSNLDSTINSCLAYHAQHTIISRILRETDFSISIRPHPLEDISSYHKYVIPSFGKEYSDRLSIDDSLDISEWIIKQRALVSPTSTAYVEAYLLNVPFINVDRITDMYEYNAVFAIVCRQWLESAYVPNTIDEAIELVRDAPNLSIRRPVMDQQISDYCGLPCSRPSTLQVLEAIHRLVVQHGTKLHRETGLPLALLGFIDDLLYRRLMLRDRRHKNFHYNRNYHKLPRHISATFQELQPEIRAIQAVAPSTATSAAG